MADKSVPSWKFTAAALIWIIVAAWIIISLVVNDLGGILAALAFGAIGSMLLTGYSTSDVEKL